MNATPLVLLVGHCMPDSFGLSRTVKSAIPGAKVERVNSDKALKNQLNDASLLLVNRALDGRFHSDDGVALIRRLREEGIAASIMLISNYPEAQAAAVEVGALPGFGKRQLHDPATTERLRTAVALDPSSSA